MNFCPNLVQHRFKNMYLNESFTQSSTVILSTNKGRSRAMRRRRFQYDPAIIERTKGLVLAFTALYRSFLKQCTLTNKAMGTI